MRKFDSLHKGKSHVPNTERASSDRKVGKRRINVPGTVVSIPREKKGELEGRAMKRPK